MLVWNHTLVCGICILGNRTIPIISSLINEFKKMCAVQISRIILIAKFQNKLWLNWLWKCDNFFLLNRKIKQNFVKIFFKYYNNYIRRDFNNNLVIFMCGNGKTYYARQHERNEKEKRFYSIPSLVFACLALLCLLKFDCYLYYHFYGYFVKQLSQS